MAPSFDGFNELQRNLRTGVRVVLITASRPPKIRKQKIAGKCSHTGVQRCNNGNGQTLRQNYLDNE